MGAAEAVCESRLVLIQARKHLLHYELEPCPVLCLLGSVLFCL